MVVDCCSFESSDRSCGKPGIGMIYSRKNQHGGVCLHACHVTLCIESYQMQMYGVCSASKVGIRSAATQALLVLTTWLFSLSIGLCCLCIQRR